MGNCIPGDKNLNNQVGTADGKMRKSRKGASAGTKERYAIVDGKYDVKLPYEKKCTINCAAFLPTGDIVLGDSDNCKIKLFNGNFDFMSATEFPEPVVHLASSPNLPLIYAIFPDRIRQIHVDGVNLKKSGFIKTPGQCRAMVVNIFDGKAVALKMPEGYGQVNLLTPGGNLQMEIFENDKEEALFIQPEALVVTRNLVIVVADIAQQAVIGVTPEREVVFTYRGIRSPTALMCDEQNYIYIAGPNNVHQLTEKESL